MGSSSGTKKKITASGAVHPKAVTEHHRKPKSIGGAPYDPRNISMVTHAKHEAWHVLFLDLPATDIMERFRDDYDAFGSFSSKTKQEVMIYEEWIRGNPRNLTRQKAWGTLFKNKSLEEIVRQINTVWLDPDYILTIGTVRAVSINLSHAAKIK